MIEKINLMKIDSKNKPNYKEIEVDQMKLNHFYHSSNPFKVKAGQKKIHYKVC